MRSLAIGILAAAVALAATGCGGSSSASGPTSGVAGARHAAKSPTVTTRTVKGLGTILVNAKGVTLYMFEPDHHKHVTCTGSCAAIWPPLKLKAGQKPTAGGSAKASLLGSDKSPAGYHVATYNGWPLYTYVADAGKPGKATGQGVNLNGGLWYVLSPSGKVITKKVHAAGSSSGGY